MTGPTHGDTSRVPVARAVVLAVLLSNVAGAVVLVLTQVEPPGAVAWSVVAGLVAVHAAAHVLVVRAAVTPWREPRAGQAAGLVGVTLLAWAPLGAWAESGDAPWAWLAGFTLGALVVSLPWGWTVAVAAAALGLAAAGAARWGEDPVLALVFLAMAAVAAGALDQVVVWLLGLLVTAETGREAQARLAVAEERLRFARELHDAVGHRLTVIALQAELAGSDEIRGLAATAQRELREAVHGYGTLDLDDQLRAASLVLGSAGVDVRVSTDPVGLDGARSRFLAGVVREGVTNVLRHSDARTCRVELTSYGDRVRLVVVNDRARPQGASPGTGLRGLVEAGAALGARVGTDRLGDEFRLVAEVPRD